MSETIVHELAPIGSTPISEANPCGDSVRYEPEFEQLEAEMAKLESLKGEPVDWKTVVRTSSDILQRKSKDLLVAVYLCQGLLQTEGFRGLAVGLQIINDMANAYWEPMYPAVKRLRARKVAMEWLSEKASLFVSNHTRTDKDNESVVQAAQISRELDGFLADKMGNEAPTMTDLTRPLKQFHEAIKQQAAKAAQTVAAPAPVAAQSQESVAVTEPVHSTIEQSTPVVRAATSTAPSQRNVDAEAVQVNVESDADARKALRQLQDGLRKVAGFYAKSKLSDPKAFRLSRTAVWMTIEQLPPNKDGLTQIPSPPVERRKQMAALFEQSQFSSLIPEIEQLNARSAFWLDGQRLVANALKSLGSEYTAAREVVIGELTNFLERLPGVANLKFSDGTPFADDTTKMWIESEVMTQSSSSESSSGQKSEKSDPWNEALSEAKVMAASGDLGKAVQKFHFGIERSSGIREQFYWRTGLSELLIQSGNINVAVQMLEQMISRIELQRLEEWESELTVPVYRRLFEAYQKIAAKKKGDAAVATKMDSIYSKLCWLDPMMAITVKGE